MDGGQQMQVKERKGEYRGRRRVSKERERHVHYLKLVEVVGGHM